ncbi:MULTISPECIES: efflux transporter outer membrane subunit [unclassified Sphingomonas]|uniref:efflux transporter outer membrane subunit n=1 Tax=unclassified Sphingomonas TaxID=196159 RepID=UPI001D10529D|nr:MULTISPECIES: efflux transporter outer membrane subunit [unclassified Sphingomonas]MCC2980679.1 efflux transporter outer membrane subunit [Sphingomonas sp. IC4-52]MCD2316790.1 efflux transporter outer membrane subunit [Sphingomonas sp. IC-11]
MRRLVLPSALALVGGCTVGPDYKGPPAAASQAVDRGTFVRARDPALSATPGLARWWEALGDPTLDALVQDALAHNPSLDQASARIREAEAQLRQQRAARLPSASATGQYLYAELPGVGLGAPGGGSGGNGGQDGAGDGGTALEFYNVGLNVSWEIDLFGGGRRGVEQARATAAAREADLADAQVSLSAQVAQAYVALRDIQARIRLNAESTRLQQQQLALTRQRVDRGTASRLQLERLQNQLENTEAEAIPLGAQRDEQLNLLAVLTGQAPGAVDTMLAADAPVPLPPATVPIGNPAALIAQRPDIRAAERQLAAATAGVGVNKAKELPGISFMGLLGLGGTKPGDIFDLGNLTTLIAPSLNWSFLDFGRARAATRASEAQRDSAEAGYRQAVLEALQEAETALSRFGSTRAQLGRFAQAEATANRAAALNRQRVEAGTTTVIDQLDVERQRIAAAAAVAQAKAQLTQSYIAINKALGLGWRAPNPNGGAGRQTPGAALR